MGLFGKLFERNKSYEELLLECQAGVLSAYEINSPSDVEKFRSLLAIAIALTGILNDVGSGRINHIIDEITDTAQRLTSNLTFKLNEVAASNEELSTLLSEFPAIGQANANLRTNGNIVFSILFNHLGPDAVKEISEKSGGPLGAPGFAAIVVGNLVVGKARGRSGFMLVSGQLLQTTQAIAKKI